MAETMATTAVTLPDDVLLEILVRLTDVAALFRCATACKRWRALITDPSFLRRRWPKDAGDASSLLGFFTQRPQHMQEGSIYMAPAPLPVFVASPRPALGPARCFLRFFAPERVDASLLDSAVPLAAHRGLLLVRLVPRSGPPEIRRRSLHLVVFNPIAGTCSVLPPLNLQGFCNGVDIRWCYGVVAGEDCSSNEHRPDFFKVLVIGARYNLCTFTSTESVWRKPGRSVEAAIPWAPLGQSNAVVYRGSAHWLLSSSSMFCTLAVCAETDSLVFRRIPFDKDPSGFHHEPHLSVAADGALCLFCLHHNDLRLEMWTRREDDGRWLFSTVVQLKRPEHRGVEITPYMCLAAKSGTMLIGDNNGGCLYFADLKTKQMEEVADRLCSFNRDLKVVPFEMDWPALFLSRLLALVQVI